MSTAEPPRALSAEFATQGGQRSVGTALDIIAAGGNDEQKFLQQQERAGRTRQNRQ